MYTVALALVRMVIINQRKTPDKVKDIQVNILERCALQVGQCQHPICSAYLPAMQHQPALYSFQFVCETYVLNVVGFYCRMKSYVAGNFNCKWYNDQCANSYYNSWYTMLVINLFNIPSKQLH